MIRVLGLCGAAAAPGSRRGAGRVGTGAAPGRAVAGWTSVRVGAGVGVVAVAGRGTGAGAGGRAESEKSAHAGEHFRNTPATDPAQRSGYRSGRGLGSPKGGERFRRRAGGAAFVCPACIGHGVRQGDAGPGAARGGDAGPGARQGRSAGPAKELEAAGARTHGGRVAVPGVAVVGTGAATGTVSRSAAA
jgi:hypothetical protein